MNIKQIIYFTLAIVGAVGTWFFNLQALDGFFSQMFATPVSSSLTVDLLVVITVFYIWLIDEVRRHNMSKWWLFGALPLSFIIAIAFVFPLFLGFRERAILRSSVEETADV
ncbi:MAG: DUF2834 domain-containing protein [Chloroflexota bacterium]